MFELKIVTEFAAAHQLEMVAQKCENLHGHNWKVEVCVVGTELDAGGVLVDFGVVKKHLAAVIKSIDHQFLNQLPAFGKTRPPSSENIARHIAKELQERLQRPNVRVSRVTAWESSKSAATYIAAGGPMAPAG